MLQIGGKRTFENEALSRQRMDETDERRVQSLTREGRKGFAPFVRAAKRGAAPSSVKGVADEPMPQMGEMDPYLVGAAGAETAFEFRGRAGKRPDHAITGDGRSPLVFGEDRHLFAVRPAASDVADDPAFRRDRNTPYKRPVGAFDPPRGEIARQGLVRGLAFGGEEKPARILVEAVNDPRTRLSAYPGKALAAMVEEGVDEGSVGISRRRVNDEPCGLVDDDQMCILEADVERDLLRGRRGRRGFGESDEEILAALYSHRRVAKGRAFENDMALFDKALQPRTRKPFEAAREKAVEALAAVARFGADADPAAAKAAFDHDHGRNAAVAAGGPSMPIRGLTIFVIVMGVVIVLGFAVVVATIAGRLARGGGGSSFGSSAIVIPKGGRVRAMTAEGGRLILSLSLPQGKAEILIIDLKTGARLGAIALNPAP